jgi:mannose-1-phosphate guanylyltransferase
MNLSNIYPVVIAGGRGERFWPKSRTSRPKQFLRIFGRTSLIQDTQRRITHLAPVSNHRYVVPEVYLHLLFKEIRVHRSSVLVEPEGKNTFPAICLAAVHLPNDGIMVVLPSDHLIRQEGNFYRAVKFACELAEKEYFVLFGIEPTRVETGYGYIKIGEKISEKEDLIAFTGLSFREKPDYETCQTYLASKLYLWNSGIFCWRVELFLKEVANHYPDFFRYLSNYQKAIGTKNEKNELKELYKKAPAISVDYALMEKVTRIAVVKGNFLWDDVGNWLALERHFKKDPLGNVRIGPIIPLESSNSILYTEDTPIFPFGVSDLIVVKTKDLLFLCPKEKAEEIKRFLNFLAGNIKGKRFL